MTCSFIVTSRLSYWAASSAKRMTSAGPRIAAGLPVVVVNPRQARDFAKATGHLAKPDSPDAGVLAPFAEVARPAPHPRRAGEAFASFPCSSAFVGDGSSLWDKLINHKVVRSGRARLDGDQRIRASIGHGDHDSTLLPRVDHTCRFVGDRA